MKKVYKKVLMLSFVLLGAIMVSQMNVPAAQTLTKKGNSTLNKKAILKVVAKPPVPSFVAGCIGVQRKVGSATFKWGKLPSKYKYIVKLTSYNFKNKKIGQTKTYTTSQTSFTLNNLTEKYYYKASVQSYCKVNGKKYYSKANDFKFTTVQLRKSFKVTKKRLYVQWKKINGVKKYRAVVYYKNGRATNFLVTSNHMYLPITAKNSIASVSVYPDGYNVGQVDLKW